MGPMRWIAALLMLCFASSAIVAKDVDAKAACRAVDNVFAKSDAKAREKELAKLDGDTLDAPTAAEARSHALQLQRKGPKQLPKLEEAHEGALSYDYEVRAKRTVYKTFALLDLPPGISADKPVSLVLGLHSALGTAWSELRGLRSCAQTAADHPLRNCIIACPNALNRGNTADDPRGNPPGPTEYFGWGPKQEGIDSILNLLDQLLAAYNIDLDRIYIVGAAGMGGEAAFHIAQLRPSQFAAICVRDTLPPCHYPELPAKTDLEALRKAKTLGDQKVEFPWAACYLNTPIYWLHSDGDTRYPTAHARQCRDAMLAAKVPLKYTEYEGTHGSGSTQQVAAVVREALQHGRALPHTITARGMRDGGNRNFWLQIDKQSLDGKAAGWPAKANAGGLVTAQLDRERNAIIVTSDGVREVTVYLYDEFLNLDAEITLIVNGRERKVSLQRELKVLARTAAEFAGTGEVYTAAIAITM